MQNLQVSSFSSALEKMLFHVLLASMNSVQIPTVIHTVFPWVKHHFYLTNFKIFALS